MEQAAENAFLHALCHRPEQRVDGIIVEQGHGQQGFLRIVRHPVGSSEGDDDLAAAVAAVRTCAGKPHQRPAAQPPQLPLAQGDIRSQHRDDGAFILVGRDAVAQQGVDRRARHDEVIEQRMVGEH